MGNNFIAQTMNNGTVYVGRLPNGGQYIYSTPTDIFSDRPGLKTSKLRLNFDNANKRAKDYYTPHMDEWGLPSIEVCSVFNRNAQRFNLSLSQRYWTNGLDIGDNRKAWISHAKKGITVHKSSALLVRPVHLSNISPKEMMKLIAEAA